MRSLVFVILVLVAACSTEQVPKQETVAPAISSAESAEMFSKLQQFVKDNEHNTDEERRPRLQFLNERFLINVGEKDYALGSKGIPSDWTLVREIVQATGEEGVKLSSTPSPLCPIKMDDKRCLYFEDNGVVTKTIP